MVSKVSLNRYGAAIIGVSWMEAFISLVLVLLRLYTRLRVVHHGIGADDIFMIFSGLLIIASAAANTVAVQYGFGYHYFNLTGEQFSRTILMEMICETTMLIGIITSKCSVALFLLRLFIKQWQKWVLWFIMITLAIVCLFTALVNWFQCNPIDFAWSTRQGPGSCWINISTPSIFAGAWCALVDFTLAGIPWIVVYSLDIRRKEKLTIAISLSLGAIAGVCGIIRTYELKQLESSLDYTYATVPTLLWALSELVITVIAANIPCLRPLYNQMRGITQTGRSAPSPTDDAGQLTSKDVSRYTLTSSNGQTRAYGSWEYPEELHDMPLRSNSVRLQRGYDGRLALSSNTGSGIHIKEEIDISRQPMVGYRY